MPGRLGTLARRKLLSICNSNHVLTMLPDIAARSRSDNLIKRSDDTGISLHLAMRSSAACSRASRSWRQRSTTSMPTRQL